MAAEIDLIGADGSDGAGRTDGGVALNENHARHIPGNEMRVIGLGSGGASLRGNEAIALKLVREGVQRFRLVAGENERSFNRLERGALREAGVRSCGLRKGKLSVRLVRVGFGSELRLRTKNVFYGRDAANGFLGKNA